MIPCDKIIGAFDTALVSWKDGEKPEEQFYCCKKYLAAEGALLDQNAPPDLRRHMTYSSLKPTDLFST